MLARKSLLLTRKSKMLTRKSLLLTSKSEMLTRKSLLLTSKSEMLARKSLLLTRQTRLTPSWRDGWARAQPLRQIAQPVSYQSELVHFLTGHAFGVDDVTEQYSRWRAPNRVLSVGHFS